MPPGRDVNAPSFVERIRTELCPDASLALMVPQLFGPPLLDACRSPANYHDGLLPRYRGFRATAWSVYRGEPRSGFAFHRMSAGVDDGPVLVRDAVPVPPGAGPIAVERAKMRLACARMGEALERLRAGDPGQPQRGEASSFTIADFKAIRTVRDPACMTWDELLRRLRAFEMLAMRLGGAWFTVTRLRRVAGAPSVAGLAFTTADGVRAEPDRFMFVPWALHRRRRTVKRRYGFVERPARR